MTNIDIRTFDIRKWATVLWIDGFEEVKEPEVVWMRPPLVHDVDQLPDRLAKAQSCTPAVGFQFPEIMPPIRPPYPDPPVRPRLPTSCHDPMPMLACQWDTSNEAKGRQQVEEDVAIFRNHCLKKYQMQLDLVEREKQFTAEHVKWTVACQQMDHHFTTRVQTYNNQAMERNAMSEDFFESENQLVLAWLRTQPYVETMRIVSQLKHAATMYTQNQKDIQKWKRYTEVRNAPIFIENREYVCTGMSPGRFSTNQGDGRSTSQSFRETMSNSRSLFEKDMYRLALLRNDLGQMKELCIFPYVGHNDTVLEPIVIRVQVKK